MLSPNKLYSRIGGIIYENGIPIIKLKQKFTDIKDLEVKVIKYMNNYLNQFPDLHEQIKEKKMYKPIVKMFYDLETTGTDHNKNGIHQLSGIIEIDDLIVETFDYRIKPHPKSVIEDAALKASNTTREDLETFPEMIIVYREVLALLGKHCDRFNKHDKIWLIGYNNRSFDDPFFRKWFELNGDSFFGSWFWSDSLDVLVLASEYLLERRRSMPNFKLVTVAKELGIVVDDTALHNAEYDSELTRMIYRIVTGKEIEI